MYIKYILVFYILCDECIDFIAGSFKKQLLRLLSLFKTLKMLQFSISSSFLVGNRNLNLVRNLSGHKYNLHTHILNVYYIKL